MVNCVRTLREHRASDRVSGCTPCTARLVGVAKWALLCPLLWALLTRQLPRVHHLRRHHKNNVLENDFYGIKSVYVVVFVSQSLFAVTVRRRASRSVLLMGDANLNMNPIVSSAHASGTRPTPCVSTICVAGAIVTSHLHCFH